MTLLARDDTFDETKSWIFSRSYALLYLRVVVAATKGAGPVYRPDYVSRLRRKLTPPSSPPSLLPRLSQDVVTKSEVFSYLIL